MESWLKRQWYGLTYWQWLLWPLSQLFFLLSAVRRQLYRTGVFKSWRAPVPVIVVGNISVGGTGKTPLTLWLAEFLRQHGYHPGIVSRGYGGNGRGVRAVTPSSDAGDVGDEPILLARRAACPVWVGRDRPAAARGLLAAHPQCDILICDDGLQHYALARDLEIAVGGVGSLGNRRLLPAGPLRETPERLREVDLVVSLAASPSAGEHGMQISGSQFRNLLDANRIAHAQDFAGQNVHAIAGIGQPQRFFDSLRALGVICREHPFPDHHPFRATDLQFDAAQVMLMTEKDAVKCMRFAQPEWWYLEVHAQLGELFGARILEKIRS